MEKFILRFVAHFISAVVAWGSTSFLWTFLMLSLPASGLVNMPGDGSFGLSGWFYLAYPVVAISFHIFLHRSASKYIEQNF
jgi:hypothetical protein